MGCIKARTCPKGHRYEVLIFGDSATVVEKGDAEDCFELTCPTCGSPEFTEVWASGGQTPHGAGYPYFDLGLGENVQSAQHRAQLMREKGLICLEGEAERVMQEQRSATAQLQQERERRKAEQDRRQQADPEIRKGQAKMQQILAESRTMEDFIRSMYGNRADDILKEV